MNDESKILREIDEMPRETLQEGLISVLERDLKLPSLKGVDSIVKPARLSRYRLLSRIDEHAAAFKERLHGHNAGAVDAAKARLLKEGVEFWYAHRADSAEAAFAKAAYNLKPIEGDSPIYDGAREARCRLLRQIFNPSEGFKGFVRYVKRRWLYEETDASQWFDGVFMRLFMKEAAFWQERRDSSAEAMFMAEALGLQPIESGSPIHDDALKARYRILLQIFGSGYRRFAEQSSPEIAAAVSTRLRRERIDFWNEHRDSTAETAFAAAAFDLQPMAGDTPIHRIASEARYRIFWELLHERFDNAGNYYRLVKDLKTKDAQFWHSHSKFSAEDLIHLHYSDADGVFRGLLGFYRNRSGRTQCIKRLARRGGE